MYRALVNRDPSFEGIFYIGVRTTGFSAAHMLGKKTGTRKRRFFCNIKQRIGERLSASLALPSARCDPRPPKLIERLRAEVERAPAGRLTDKELAALSIDPSTARRESSAIMV